MLAFVQDEENQRVVSQSNNTEPDCSNAQLNILTQIIYRKGCSSLQFS